MAGKVDLKVVLLGKEYGGKTSLVERYIHGKFNSNAPYQSVSLDSMQRVGWGRYFDAACTIKLYGLKFVVLF